jgi:hypothetical protein
MKVNRLIELLRRCDPESFVTIRVPNCNRDYVAELTDKPACLLYFFLEQREDCSYSDYPHLPPMKEVVIHTSLDAKFFITDDPEMIQEVAENLVEPDFRPEAN